MALDTGSERLGLHTQIKLDELKKVYDENFPLLTQNSKRLYLERYLKTTLFGTSKFNPKKHKDHRRERNKTDLPRYKAEYEKYPYMVKQPEGIKIPLQTLGEDEIKKMYERGFILRRYKAVKFIEIKDVNRSEKSK